MKLSPVWRGNTSTSKGTRMLLEPKIRLSAVQPEGVRNGLAQPETIETLTRGYEAGSTYLAVVELRVAEQVSNIDKGTLTNVVAFNRIELVDGDDAERAIEILRAAHDSRHDSVPLAGIDFDRENVNERGDA